VLWIGASEPSLYSCRAVGWSGKFTSPSRVNSPSAYYDCATENRDGAVFLGTALIALPDGRLSTDGLLRNLNLHVTIFDRENVLWAGGQGEGLYRYEHGRQTHFSVNDGLVGNDVRSLLVDRTNNLYIGTQDGLSVFNGKSFTNYTTKDGLPNNWIRSMYMDRDGELWIATDGGLGSRKGDRFYSYGRACGILSNIIHVVLEDDSSRLWMSTNKGVIVVRKRDLDDFDAGRVGQVNYRLYNEADGMRSAEGNGTFPEGGCRLADGRLCFATVKGVVVVDPNHLPRNRVVPPVVIERVVADGKEVSLSPRPVFPYGTKKVEFRFAVLSYRNPVRNSYRYRLDGYDSVWTEERNQTKVAYLGLSPGTYTFRVTGANDDGLWNPKGGRLTFTISTPFWLTWWFRTLLLLSAVTLLTWALKYLEMRKINARIAHIEHEQALERERSRISKDLHDDVGSMLTKILFLSSPSKDFPGGGMERISATAEEAVRKWTRLCGQLTRETTT